MASASARPKGVRPPCDESFLAAARCSCLDQRPAVFACVSLRCPHRLPALSSSLRRRRETDHASWKALRQSRPVRVKVFRGLLREATAEPPHTCAWPTTGPDHHAALRESLRSPCGLPLGLPKPVLSLCS